MEPWFDWSLIDEDEIEAPDGARLQDAVAAASLILHRLSGRVYGIERYVMLPFIDAPQWPMFADLFFTDRMRPARQSVLADRGLAPGLVTGWDQGLRRNRIELPLPVRTMHEVKISNVVLDPSLYWVWGPRVTFNAAGSVWPTSPKPDAAVLRIDATVGSRPPVDGVRAARIYAVELYKAWAGDEDCRLPSRVQSLIRQGLQVVMLSPTDFIDRGKTGLVDVDNFIASVNPGGNTVAPSVTNPEFSGVYSSFGYVRCRHWTFALEPQESP